MAPAIADLLEEAAPVVVKQAQDTTFFTELSRRAAMCEGDKRGELERRIVAARDLMGGSDAVERFLQWTVPAMTAPDRAGDDVSGDDGGEEDEVEDD